MFIRTKTSKAGNSHRVQIVESVKEGKRTRQVIVKHIGFAHNDEELAALKKIAMAEMERHRDEKAGGLLFDATDSLLEQSDLMLNHGKLNVRDCVAEKTVAEGSELVYGKIFDDLGFGEILDASATQVLRKVVTERTQEPESKLALAERSSEFGEEFLSVDRIYRMMDKLSGKTDEVRELVRKNAERHMGGQIDVVFYDCTTLYFESTDADDLRNFGFSKDHKCHQTQVVLAVATTGRGLPVDFQVFPGNTAETTTLLRCLERWKGSFPVGTVTFVADRGLFSIKNLTEIKEAGYDFIVACPLRKLEKNTVHRILDHFSPSNPESGENQKKPSSLQEELTLSQRVKDSETGKYVNRDVTGTLTVDYSESRAYKDVSDRERLLKKIRGKVGNGPSSPKELISNSGYKKFVAVHESGKIEINEKKIAEDKRWDGIHGIFSSLRLTPEEIRSRYQHLWTIEETFRISKNDLEIRPIYHWKKRRIEAHISLCYLSLAIARHIEVTLRNKGVDMSVRRITQAIGKIQACVVRDQSSQKKFRLPIALPNDSRQVLEALQIPYKTSVTFL